MTEFLDSSKPSPTSAKDAYFLPPRMIAHPDESHSLAARAFQGIPSLAISPAGRLWATWYAGSTPAEDHNNYVVLATCGDAGKTWKEVLIIDPDGSGPVRAFDPELWLDPQGKLWFFWAQSITHHGAMAGVWAITNDAPDSDNSQWSSPRRLTNGVMMCKPTVLSSGEWLLPASTWRTTDDSAKAVFSMDNGRTWVVRSGCNVPVEDRDYDEHMIVERKDHSLWMLVRTNYGIGESISYDRGQTWPTLTRSRIQHASSRFFISRLASGNLLLIKHGPIELRIDRSCLQAFLSNDDGLTWAGGLMLDDRQEISYPDGQQHSDGTICIVYDRSRTGAREILMARFNEQDVLAARADSTSVITRMRVSAPDDGH